VLGALWIRALSRPRRAAAADKMVAPPPPTLAVRRAGATPPPLFGPGAARNVPTVILHDTLEIVKNTDVQKVLRCDPSCYDI